MMKKILLGTVCALCVTYLSSCSKEAGDASTESSVPNTSSTYGEPILHGKDNPLSIAKSPNSAADEDVLWIDKVEAYEFRYGNHVSRNGYIEINSNLLDGLYYSNMNNTYGDSDFNTILEGYVALIGRYGGLLDDYCVAVLFHADRNINTNPYPLVVAATSEGGIDCNFVITGSNYLAYQSYLMDYPRDYADWVVDYRVLWLSRTDNQTFMNIGYGYYGDINEEYALFAKSPNDWNYVAYQTWATTDVVFGDPASDFWTSMEPYNGSNEGLRIGTIYLFPKPNL